VWKEAVVSQCEVISCNFNGGRGKPCETQYMIVSVGPSFELYIFRKQLEDLSLNSLSLNAACFISLEV
jgi:hypothetical protein